VSIGTTDMLPADRDIVEPEGVDLAAVSHEDIFV
jgi:hypothetical protein